MYIKDLSVLNFRNIKDTKVELSENINIFYGDNAQGKTNFLEAIYVCSIGRSQRTKFDSQLIKFGYDEAHIRTFVVRKNYSGRIDVHLKKSVKKGMAINGMPARKISEFLGNLITVIFSPEDLRLVKGSPSERRKFMDLEICQLSKIYCYDLQQYYKVLKQRNNLLKSHIRDKSYYDTLDVWDMQLSDYGERIIKKREEFIRDVNLISKNIHANITDNKEELRMEYESSVEKDSFLEKITNSRDRDIALGSTNIGPHKDDIIFFINDNDTKLYGSQGQQRTAALSAKLAEVELIRQEIGENPVLLLDDVLSELDENRQRFLINNIENLQTFITCTGIEGSIYKSFRKSTMYNIKNGEIV